MLAHGEQANDKQVWFMSTTPSTLLSRRTFLKTIPVLGGGLCLALSTTPLASVNSREKASSALLPLIKITPHGKVIIPLIMSEMGQGVITSLPQIIAEELDADWESIEVISAEADEDKYGYQGSLASLSIVLAWKSHREAGAKARKMLIDAAAKVWKVTPSDCFTAKGAVFLRNSESTLTYGELAPLAANMPIPQSVEHKPQENFNIVGKSLSPIDLNDKIGGKTQFGIDVNLRGLLNAAILKKPVFGATLKGFDKQAALNIKGVVDAFEIKSGIAVVANSYWTAYKATQVLNAQWKDSELQSFSSSQLEEKLKVNLNAPNVELKNLGNVDQHIDDSEQHTATFKFPLLAHAPLEPVNFTAHVKTDSCELWGPTQHRGRVKNEVAEYLELPTEKVTVNTTFIGGGFGRKVYTDFVLDAVEISQKIKLPVKVTWSRENDTKHGVFRPMSVHKLSARTNAESEILSWQHTVASHGSEDAAWLSTAGADHLPYKIKNFRANAAITKSPIPVGTLRGIAHSCTNFANEVFINQLADKLGTDPVSMRINMLAANHRATRVLKRVAKLSQWNKPNAKVYRGIALFDKTKEGATFYIAQVVEVIKASSGKLKISKVFCSADFGIPINPDGMRAQIEGGIAFALSMALYGKIDIDNGAVRQSNFHDYRVLRHPAMPEVLVDLVNSGEHPIGCGENINPATLPALASAVSKAIDQDVNTLPFDTNLFASSR